MKRAAAVVAALAATLTLTACDASDTREIRIKRLPDGREVTCISLNKGLSCDWANAK